MTANVLQIRPGGLVKALTRHFKRTAEVPQNPWRSIATTLQLRHNFAATSLQIQRNHQGQDAGYVPDGIYPGLRPLGHCVPGAVTSGLRPETH